MRYCAAALFGLALSSSAGVAQAQTAFTVEGPITGIDPAKHTITVGYDFVVEIPTTIKFTAPAPLKRAFLSVTPAALKPTITGADLTPLLDVNAPSRVRSILHSDQAVPATVLGYSGGTGTFTGLTTIDANGVVHNTAATADVMMAENVLGGVLQSVDLTTGIFVVQGHRCKMNVDERFRSEILDGGNNPVSLPLLAASGIGDIMTVQGYMLDGLHHTTTLTTTALVGPQGVTIASADGVIKSGMIKAKGDVGKIIAGQTVSLYNTTTGALITTVPVLVGALPGTGTWVFNSKTAVSPLPTSLTVVTSNGLTATKAMTNK
ncbi:MAG: hypothetical protein DWH81_15035 [Planctomycetota bacterium]|nr:MAG: hypothetical protein DWH81_15035 [Planctomycetota bacterium]